MRITDILMTVVLMLLMAFQVTKQSAHEWLGIAMTVLVTVHQIFNRKFYTSIFSGKHSAIRAVQISVNVLLLLSFAVTAVSGISMSGHAVPFLSGFLRASTARQIHLVMSYWSFVLMGVHIGMHLSVVAGRLPNGKPKIAAAIFMSLVSAYGLMLFLNADIPSYMLMRVKFAFFDYKKSAVYVLLENLAMLSSVSFMAYLVSAILKSVGRKNSDSKKTNRKKVIGAFAALSSVIIFGTLLHILTV